MPVAPKTPAPPSRFDWLGQYGWLLGLLLAAVALYTSTPMMPGPLSNAHAQFEKSCRSCHLSDRVVSDAACLKCHNLIGTAQSPSAMHRKVSRGCTACHQEHRSRQYPLRMSDPLSFDHDETGFQLKKHHPAAACSACHQPGKPYYSVTKGCAGCHRAWDHTNFKHRKTTGVSLLKHADFACTDCHPGKRYESPPVCTPCHKKVYRPGDPL